MFWKVYLAVAVAISALHSAEAEAKAIVVNFLNLPLQKY
jgi:hypothetical protein